MTTTVVVHPSRTWSTSTRAHRALKGRVLAVWVALLFNVLAFQPGISLLPIPYRVGQLLTQGTLVLAVLLAMVANPRGALRPNLVLGLLTLLGVVTLMVSIHNIFVLGSTYRACRLVVFLAVLWLLTPWWGRRDMLLLRCHLWAIWAVVGTVLLGAVVSPGRAFSFNGRLSGVLWPVPPTQVAHLAAVLFGSSVVLWMCRVVKGRPTLLALAVSGITLVLTHTRTALGGVIVGLFVASASLFLGHARVRRVSAWGVVAGVVTATFFASGLMTWLMRGQSAHEAGQLTGRTKVWALIFAMDRTRLQDLFGAGLSNQSFDGLPIDNSWLATYVDQGWFGVVVIAAVVLLLLLMAANRPRGPRRAIALFLVAYCIVSSFTETGLDTPSPYLLDLVVAGSLLLPTAGSPGISHPRARFRGERGIDPSRGAPLPASASADDASSRTDQGR